MSFLWIERKNFNLWIIKIVLWKTNLHNNVFSFENKKKKGKTKRKFMQIKNAVELPEELLGLQFNSDNCFFFLLLELFFNLFDTGSLSLRTFYSSC